MALYLKFICNSVAFMPILLDEVLLIARPLYRHGRKYQAWMFSGASQTRLGSIFCLIAFLALFFLPLAHQRHLHALEGLHAPHATGVDQKDELQLSAPEHDEPQHSHHDASSCSICQAALSARYFSVLLLTISPVLSLPVQRFRHNATTSVAANADILVSEPRAPPISL